MRVSQISVKGLFNTFEDLIRLNLDGRITIIHGLNGLGNYAAQDGEECL